MAEDLENWRVPKHRRVIGLNDDPVVQVLASELGEGPVTIASQHVLLARGDLAVDRSLPRRVILRRIGNEESDTDWEMSIYLAVRLVESAGNRDIEFVCLTEAASVELTAVTGREVKVLDGAGRSPAPALRGIWSPEKSRIDIPELGTYLDDTSVSWARLRYRVSVATAADVPADCQDIASFAGRGSSAASPALSGEAAILVIVPNGVGLGHLTRELAVARHLAVNGSRVVFWCYSHAAGLIAKEGFEVLARQTAEHLGADPSLWILHESAELAAFIQENGIGTVVQDGGRVSPAVGMALRRGEVGDVALVLIRRGMWQPGKNLTWRDTEQLTDLVLEPSDLALEADEGATNMPSPDNRGFSSFARVAPVILTRKEEMLERSVARERIGIAGEERWCLINLGGDALVSHNQATLLIRKIAEHSGVRLCWLASPLASAASRLAADMHVLQGYPTAHLMNAFDGLITAAGYNSLHEALMIMDVPILFVPHSNARLDDQLRRARFAEAKGWARVLSFERNCRPPDTLADFFAAVHRGDKAQRSIAVPDGAKEIADRLSSLTLHGGVEPGRE